MKLVIQQLQNKVEMSWIVANSQQFTSCKFSQYICRGKAEDIYFTQIGSFLTSSPNLSGLQMRRCKFIFSGKWDFDRKFTERLPAAAGCLTQQTATIHCMCTNTALLVLHYCTTLHWKFCTLLSTAAAHWGTICVHNETLTLDTENPCA